MPKKPFVWLTVMLSMLLPLAAACGSTPSTSTDTSHAVTPPGGENLYVLDGYTPAVQSSNSVGQHIIVFHPGSTNPAMTLPLGLTSMDHQRLIATQVQKNQTTISVVDTQDGTIIRSLVINGSYSTAEPGFDNAVLSFDGHWLALRQLSQSTSATTIALVDTQAGKLTKAIHLSGDFDLDAISPDGNALYLLQRLNNGTGHYYVELYNVPENELYQSPIVDKSELNDPNMTGTAVARQVSSDGSTFYTLYIDTDHNIAFVHILPLDPGFPFARCINLPVGKSADLLHYYTLTLSADGTKLYAANGALGVASEIDLNNSGTSNIYSDQVVATQHFNPNVSSISSDDKTRALRNGAVLSPDQSTLYFVGVNGIWSVNTLDLSAKRGMFKNFLPGQSFTGIALSVDNRTLYAVNPTSGITLLDAATGQSEQVLQGPAHAPWSIEWIAN